MGKLATAQDLINTGAFSFNTSSSTVTSYVPSLSVVPSAAKIRAALKSGYKLTWSVPSTATYCVPLDEVKYSKNAGSLYLNYSNFLSQYPQATSVSGGQFSSTPGKVSDLTNYKVGPTEGMISFQSPGKAGGVNIKLNTSYTQIGFCYVTPSEQFIYVFANLTSSQISTVNNGGTVTVNATMYNILQLA